MRTEPTIKPIAEQADLPAHSDNIDKLLMRINRTKNPQAILQLLTITEPFIEHCDDCTQKL